MVLGGYDICSVFPWSMCLTYCFVEEGNQRHIYVQAGSNCRYFSYLGSLDDRTLSKLLALRLAHTWKAHTQLTSTSAVLFLSAPLSHLRYSVISYPALKYPSPAQPRQYLRNNVSRTRSRRVGFQTYVACFSIYSKSSLTPRLR